MEPVAAERGGVLAEPDGDNPNVMRCPLCGHNWKNVEPDGDDLDTVSHKRKDRT